MAGVFFVCGTPKSGTTWLQRILDAHPAVMCSGEGHFLERFTAEIIPVIKAFNTRLQVEAERVYEGKPYYPPVDQAEFDDITRHFILGRLNARRPGPEIRWIGDKTPRYALHLARLRRLFPEGRIVNIVRDPRDVAMSRLGHARRAEAANALSAEAADPDQVVALGAKDWVANVEPVAAFADAHPGMLHSLRYEDLSADPQEEMRRLFAFLDVGADAATLEPIMAATSFEAQSGRARGEEDASAFLRKGVVGDWVGRLTPSQVATIEQLCGPLMRTYGYL